MAPAGAGETALIMASCLLHPAMTVLPFAFHLCGYWAAQLTLLVLCIVSAYTFHCVPRAIESAKGQRSRLSTLRLNFDVLGELAFGGTGRAVSRCIKILDTYLSFVALASLLATELAHLLACSRTTSSIVVLFVSYFFGFSNSPTLILVALGFNDGKRTLIAYAGATAGLLLSIWLAPLSVPATAGNFLGTFAASDSAVLASLTALPLYTRVVLSWGCFSYVIAGAGTVGGMYAALKGVRHNKVVLDAKEKQANAKTNLAKARNMLMLTFLLLFGVYSCVGATPLLLKNDWHSGAIPTSITLLLLDQMWSLAGLLTVPVALAFMVIKMATLPSLVPTLDGYVTTPPKYVLNSAKGTVTVVSENKQWNVLVRCVVVASQVAFVMVANANVVCMVALVGCTVVTSLNVLFPLWLHLTLNHSVLSGGEVWLGWTLFAAVLCVAGMGASSALSLLFSF